MIEEKAASNLAKKLGVIRERHRDNPEVRNLINEIIDDLGEINDTLHFLDGAGLRLPSSLDDTIYVEER